MTWGATIASHALTMGVEVSKIEFPLSILEIRKSHKKSARVYAYTHAYTQIRDGRGQIWPPSQIGLNFLKAIIVLSL